MNNHKPCFRYRYSDKIHRHTWNMFRSHISCAVSDSAILLACSIPSPSPLHSPHVAARSKAQIFPFRSPCHCFWHAIQSIRSDCSWLSGFDCLLYIVPFCSPLLFIINRFARPSDSVCMCHDISLAAPWPLHRYIFPRQRCTNMETMQQPKWKNKKPCYTILSALAATQARYGVAATNIRLQLVLRCSHAMLTSIMRIPKVARLLAAERGQKMCHLMVKKKAEQQKMNWLRLPGIELDCWGCGLECVLARRVRGVYIGKLTL